MIKRSVIEYYMAPIIRLLGYLLEQFKLKVGRGS